MLVSQQRVNISERPAMCAINSHLRDLESCRILTWFLDTWFDSSDSLLIYVYQLRICISLDNILQACTKLYRNKNGSLISDYRITYILVVTFTWFLEPSMWFRIMAGPMIVTKFLVEVCGRFVIATEFLFML